MKVGRLVYDARIGRLLQDRQEHQCEMSLRKDVDLHVTVQTIARFIVYTDTKAGVADQGVESVQLLLQSPRDLVCLLEGLKVALSPSDSAGVAPLLQRLLCLGGMLFAL